MFKALVHCMDDDLPTCFRYTIRRVSWKIFCAGISVLCDIASDFIYVYENSVNLFQSVYLQKGFCSMYSGLCCLYRQI